MANQIVLVGTSGGRGDTAATRDDDDRLFKHTKKAIDR